MTDRLQPGSDATAHYDATTIALHWITALLVVVLWLIAQTVDIFPKGPLRSGYWSVHVLLGFLLTGALVWRVIWRSGPGRGLPPAGSRRLEIIAKATHHLLYALLVAILALGIANAFVRGTSIFGLFSLPQIGDYEWRRPLTGLHGLLANITMGLALFHAAAALMHQYVWRDGLLGRMIPALGGKT